MTTMPGNDHMASLERYAAHASTEATATLALAFEQRTQALIAYAQVADDATADRLWLDHITPRLGLDGGDEK